MRDTFLIFLLTIATAALAGAGWCGYQSLLTAVGHVVGVSIPHLGW